MTSFDQYAVNAIKFSALDYLLKPVEINDLKEAVAKAVKVILRKQSSHLQIVNLLQGLQPNAPEKKIAVHAGDKVRLLTQADIAYIESDGRYCRIYMSDAEMFVTAKYLKDFETYFGENSAFVRIGKSHLLHTAHIKSYSKGDPCIIEMVRANVSKPRGAKSRKYSSGSGAKVNLAAECRTICETRVCPNSRVEKRFCRS